MNSWLKTVRTIRLGIFITDSMNAICIYYTTFLRFVKGLRKLLTFYLLYHYNHGYAINKYNLDFIR